MKNLLIGIAVTALVLVAFIRWSWTSDLGSRRASYHVRGGKPPKLLSDKTPRQHQEAMERTLLGRPMVGIPHTPWPEPRDRPQPKIVTEVEKLLATGVLHSINLRAHQVRIEPLLWATLVIEEKRNIVAMLSAYFDAKLGDGTVYVLSNRNDNKMADYWPTSKLGVRIHQ